MIISELESWLATFDNSDFFWFLKRLSANDTQASGSHQSGIYLPKEAVFKIFPNLRRHEKNPDMLVEAFIDSHANVQTVRLVWYNGKIMGTDSRNETRITRWGGETSPVLDPENTGALVCFAIGLDARSIPVCHVWVCRHVTEEDAVEAFFGPVDPGTWLLRPGRGLPLTVGGSEEKGNCYLDAGAIPPEWLTRFPSCSEVVKTAVALSPCHNHPPDTRLLHRRDCEFQLFRSIEEATLRPLIRSGFGSIDDFLSLAQSALQRRKSRAGTSLELHAREIFLEENLVEGLNFSFQGQSEANKRPDFLFPSEKAYADTNFPTEKLKMLAVKTTCKDRWRQVLNEADRIKAKHLLTLQQGVSEKQFEEMCASNIILVVPGPNIPKFPQSIQPHLLTLESFLAEARLTSL